MKKIATVIIGAGQAGLAMSKHLADRSVEHVLLERGEVANSWRTERWDSLKLLTPNWQSRLPGYAYEGNNPDGYMDMKQVISFLDKYSERIAAPVECQTNVHSVKQADKGYLVSTNQGEWQCEKLVLANGACNIASVPKFAADLPSDIESITPLQYRNPDQLPDGGVLVVGASATGLQLAMEIQASGRQVTICVGEHVRVPRVYRGRDIKWWMDVAGVLDMDYHEVDDINRARRVPSLQLAGSDNRDDMDLNAVDDIGVRKVGRLAGIRDGKAMFSGSLANVCALADLKMNRLLNTLDEWATENDMDRKVASPHRFESTRIDEKSPLGMDLAAEGIKSVIWATGFRPDYSWLDVPVFDRKGRIRHDGGVAEVPGLYVMGLPFLRRRKSSLIDGVGDDAKILSDHLYSALYSKAA
ncbi:MAG: NAD(P)-binding domain-containing protein [Pseudomonadota bacterium]